MHELTVHTLLLLFVLQRHSGRVGYTLYATEKIYCREILSPCLLTTVPPVLYARAVGGLSTGALADVSGSFGLTALLSSVKE